MNKAALLISPALAIVFSSCDDHTSYREQLNRAKYANVQQCEKQWGNRQCKNEGGVFYSPYFVGSTSSSTTNTARYPKVYYPYTSTGGVSETLKPAPTTSRSVYNSTSGARVSSTSVTRVSAPSVSRGGFGMSSSSASS